MSSAKLGQLRWTHEGEGETHSSNRIHLRQQQNNKEIANPNTGDCSNNCASPAQIPFGRYENRSANGLAGYDREEVADIGGYGGHSRNSRKCDRRTNDSGRDGNRNGGDKEGSM